jgi:16S rRNA (cytidine1402-2'-O)-methyltransferase
MTQWHAGLYVVATPIGNLDDLSERAAEALRRAAVVAAEDTRTSGVLIRKVGSWARLVSLTEHNVESRIPELLPVAREGVVALVSDAGTPAIADPGARLVAAAHREGVPVFAVPGPSALAAALSVSGFDGPDAHFLGFLPRQQGARKGLLKHSAAAASILVFLATPGRLAKTLGEVAELLGDPETVVCRELTKLHEEVARGRASALAERFGDARGECVVVVEVPGRAGDEEEMLHLVAAMKRAGARRAAAAAEVARLTGRTREEAYAAWGSV